MGKATQKITTTTTTKKISIKKKPKAGQKVCSNCGGDGVCQIRIKKK